MNRFDSLVHVTRDGTWMDGRCDAGFPRLIAELDRAGVGRACLVGLAGIVDNDYLLECARAAQGRLVPVAGFDPSRFADASSLRDGVADIATAGFGALKLHPRLHGYDPLHPDCLAAINAAAHCGLIVFLDTLFRQRKHATAGAAEIVDQIAHACDGARIVLLHGGGPALLDVAEVVRVQPALMLDLSFTLLRYAGSSVESDIRWTMEHLDQRVVIGSDMPEFTPARAFEKAEALAEGLSAEKRANILYGNLDRLFPDTRHD